MSGGAAREDMADRTVRVVRVFDAPRDLVWRAWTEPEQLARWWGPRGLSTPLQSIVMDVRPGGEFRLTMVSDADGTEFPGTGAFREVVPPERLVFAETANPGDPIAEMVAVVTFTDLGDDRTEVVLDVTLRTTADIRDGAEAGWGSSFDRLAEVLAG